MTAVSVKTPLPHTTPQPFDWNSKRKPTISHLNKGSHFIFDIIKYSYMSVYSKEENAYIYIKSFYIYIFIYIYLYITEILVYIRCVQPNFTNPQYNLCLFFCRGTRRLWVFRGAFLKAFHVPIAFLHKVL